MKFWFISHEKTVGFKYRIGDQWYGFWGPKEKGWRFNFFKAFFARNHRLGIKNITGDAAWTSKEGR